MIYPNGTLSLSRLKRMVEDHENYVVYYEPNDEPKDWNFFKNGQWRSPSRKIIDDTVGLLVSIEDEMNGKGKIIYDFTDSYFKQHPYIGEEIGRVEETFVWNYQSQYGAKLCYKIRQCTYLGEAPEYIPLELVCYEDGFDSSCFQICSWSRDEKEGYEFHSCGSRLFKYVDKKDIETIWNVISRVDEFLATRFNKERG